jgi:hypothetical protein
MHPPVQSMQTVARNRHRGLPRGQAGLEDPAEMHDVATAPVGFVLGAQRPDSIDATQSVGHNRAAENRAAAPPARICWDHHAGVITAHHRLPAVRVAVSEYSTHLRALHDSSRS